MKRLILSVVAMVSMAYCGIAAAAGETWQVTGMGGAGGMYTPTISPFDSKLMFLSCDMSGTYRSTDGGKNWQLIHYKQIRSTLGRRPAFTKDMVLWAEENILKVSKDNGLTWTAVSEEESAPWKEAITSIATIGGNPLQVAVGTPEGVWIGDVSAEGKAGSKWRELAKGKCGGIAAIDAELFAAIAGSDNKAAEIVHYKAGEASPVALPLTPAGKNDVMALAGARGKTGDVCLFATIDNLGIAKSSDGGKTWSVAAKWQEQRDVVMPQGQTDVAYAAHEGDHDVWRTADGGKTWQSIFHMTGEQKNVEVAWTQTYLHWDYSISHLGLGIDPNDPNVVMMTSEGDFYRSNDGGKRWFQCQNEPVGVKLGDPGFRFKSIGLEVTSLWGYYFDPNDASRQYIAYTDIGFARSVDKGATWISAVEGCPWSNTFYEVAFDPSVKGRIYAACSGRHDIPHWTHLDANKGQKGGVCVSDDYGTTWKVLGKGLPALPCTSIVVDRKSTQGKVTLYTTLYEGGLYKSTDGGATWVKKSDGLGNPGNLHAMRVRIHPKTGDIYCMITGFRMGQQFQAPGGLWVSKNGGDSWTDVTASNKFPRPTDFAVDPNDDKVIYVNASTIPGAEIGGIYKTIDGGASWQRLMTDADFAKWCSPSFYEGSTVNLHPDDANIVYVGTESHGLWYSTDAGKTFKPYESFPFGSPQNVAFDPADHKTIVVTTFGGGAFRGPYLPQK